LTMKIPAKPLLVPAIPNGRRVGAVLRVQEVILVVDGPHSRCYRGGC
jgi:hypothetical protein